MCSLAKSTFQTFTIDCTLSEETPFQLTKCIFMYDDQTRPQNDRKIGPIYSFSQAVQQRQLSEMKPLLQAQISHKYFNQNSLKSDNFD